MADLQLLTRDKIAQVFKTPELARAYEALQRLAFDSADDVAAAQAAADLAQAAADLAQAAADAAALAAAAAQSTATGAQTDITTHKADTAAHGATGAVVGTTNAQVLQNKTLDGPTPFTSQTIATGAAAAVLTANKPGATTAVQTWLTFSVNGVNYAIPLWSPT